ncbi:2Fe-2S iron-sulfur cluster-binding protein [Streptomyces sp. NBC_01498]|uniref:2Fe-2S iron-sulfur cluster-binding protein n=1 Tax=Streptomyces sp. NBC_01498 TaxID=2975870 RepID=UPI002E7B4DC6|nr:2Fe-2S iron-sulfur cluster-binding protein [Streptomyces sp. NBC_01498]WTL26652.1 2Fe-2S iron-sulfur cluster-binding protein [Streptomyces sp. NBC_01498]
MTTDENENSGNPEGRGAWRPIPGSGEYDSDATAFVQLPPEDTADAPLAARGHGYVPPTIDQRPDSGAGAADPGGAGRWAPHTPQAQPDPYGYGQGHGHSHGQGHPQGYGPGPDLPHDPSASGQWSFPTAPGTAGPGPGQAPPARSHEQRPHEQRPHEQRSDEHRSAAQQPAGQWVIPVIGDELPDESGEFTTSLPSTSQWSGGAPPATLPGGARAPWATEPEPAPEPVTEPEPAPGAVADAPAHAPETAPDTDTGTGPEPEPEAVTEPGPDPEAVPEPTAGTDPEPDPEPAPLSSSNNSAEHPADSYVLSVNGTDRPVTDAWIGESLLYVLRERLGLAGAKDGCSQGECGACNVQVDGRLVASCLVPAATAAGSEVRTVEGLASDGEPSDVQRALANCGAVQCGFCVPGMAMTVHDLLEGNHAPTELETRQALSGNLCRCSGYRGVLDAVGEVIAERAASAEAADEARIPHQAPPGAGGARTAPLDPHDGGMA